MSGTRKRIAKAAEISEGTSRKFRFSLDGISREGFVARHSGQLVAYENVCRHLPVPLDYGDGVFFDSARQHFVCQTHGAVYEAASGKCVRGPCSGASLKMLPISVKDGEVWLTGCDPEE